MKADPGAVAVSASRIPGARTSDFIELTKPKLTLLVLFTTFVGFCTGNGKFPPLLLLLHTLIGTALMSGGASAFNMFKEQKTDALMKRTALRPIAAGRIQSRDALTFALLISAGGLVYLWVLVNHRTSVLSAIILLCYLFLYTPLKTRTWLSTLVGAIPGALPIVMGWTAANGKFSSGAWMLFAIVFVWQIPHFYAIGWMYRDEYARAGLPVLSVIDSSGQRTGRQAVAFIAALIAVSLLPALIGMAGPTYPVGAVVFGLTFLGYGIYFAKQRSRASARRLFVISALYLPALLILLVLDKLAAR
jgi:protoheme IX farnesyltransferase